MSFSTESANSIGNRADGYRQALSKLVVHEHWEVRPWLITGVDDPTRFKRSRTIAAHFGLTPRRFQPGEVDSV
jgi:transposase